LGTTGHRGAVPVEYAFFHGDDFGKFLKSLLKKVSDHISTIHTRADD
jgi:hypothetical protein